MTAVTWRRAVQEDIALDAFLDRLSAETCDMATDIIGLHRGGLVKERCRRPCVTLRLTQPSGRRVDVPIGHAGSPNPLRSCFAVESGGWGKRTIPSRRRSARISSDRPIAERSCAGLASVR